VLRTAIRGLGASLHVWHRSCTVHLNLKVLIPRNHNAKYLFLWWRAPQQMLRTHRSLKAYCATLWWRWLVFSFFLVMEHRWNEIDRGKTEVLGENPIPVPLCPPQIPHGPTLDRTRASAARGRRLTAWAMARPLKRVKQQFWSLSSYVFSFSFTKILPKTAPVVGKPLTNAQNYYIRYVTVLSHIRNSSYKTLGTPQPFQQLHHRL
jgi:hypothetical protein